MSACVCFYAHVRLRTRRKVYFVYYCTCTCHSHRWIRMQLSIVNLFNKQISKSTQHHHMNWLDINWLKNYWQSHVQYCCLVSFSCVLSINSPSKFATTCICSENNTYTWPLVLSGHFVNIDKHFTVYLSTQCVITHNIAFIHTVETRVVDQVLYKTLTYSTSTSSQYLSARVEVQVQQLKNTHKYE